MALRSLVDEDNGDHKCDSEVLLGTAGQIMGSGGDKGKEGPCSRKAIQGSEGKENFWALVWGEGAWARLCG